MEKFLANMYITIYDGMYSNAGIYNTLTLYSNAIMGSFSKSGVLHSAYLGIRTIAFGILIVYFIIAFGTKMQGRETSPSIVFKTLLEYFVGFALALESFDIVVNFFKLGDALAATILETAADTKGLSAYSGAFEQSLSSLGFVAQVIYVCKALVPFLICFGTDIVIIYVVVTRVLRVCANAVLSPIAICNFFDGSRHSDGMRFIKKTLAMCLQCSAIMIICAASTSLYSYITTDASRSSIFRDSAESHENVIKAKNSMVKSQSVNINALRDATEQARQNIGYVAYDDPDLHKHSATATPTTSNTYINAAYKLTQTKIAKIKEDKEEEYKKYEDTLGIQVFVRDKNGHYKYTKKGYAKLDDKYKIFNEEKMTTFMNMLLGGTNWLTMVFILVAKAGLIKKSNSICNVIVGV